MSQSADRRASCAHEVNEIVTKHREAMFAALDVLHKKGITDTDVVMALQDTGHDSDTIAVQYLDWQNDGQ